MSFLMHLVAHIPHYLVFDITLPYLFIHSSQLDFQNVDHVVAYIVSFDSRFETRKSDIIRPHYELFTQHYLTFLFTPLSSSFGIWIFSSHNVAYILSFDSSS